MTSRDLPSRDLSEAYDRKIARWRAAVDWAKTRPWALKLIQPLARGRGRFRFLDTWTTHPLHAPPPPDLASWTDASLAATWLGHATVLLRIGNKIVLTDPVFSLRVGLGYGIGTIGPARMTTPPLALRDLPPIDLVLISHAHFDHLDRPTLAKLARRRTTVVCPVGTRDLLDDLGFREVIDLDLGEIVEFDTLKVTAVPVRHWGARTILDQDRGYCGFLIESDSRRVLYGGDSAYHDAWTFIGEEGGVDLGIVGIGAYDPWIEGHADPEQAWTMTANHAGARKVIGMHHSTFKLSLEPMDDPLRRLLDIAGARASDVVCRQLGDVWRMP